MELPIDEPQDLEYLVKKIKRKKINVPQKFYVAVEANIFDENNKWIFLRRGPGCKDGRFKLEGIGGGVERSDKNFREALSREIQEEAGTNATIEIKKFLFARSEEVYDLHARINKFWIILSYIGLLKKGELEIIEESKNLGYERYSLEEIDINELTDCAKSAYKKISENWQEIELSLKRERKK